MHHDCECCCKAPGYKSRSQLYKLMNDGWLDAHACSDAQWQRLLDVDGLQKTLQGLCQWRVDSVFKTPLAVCSLLLINPRPRRSLDLSCQ